MPLRDPASWLPAPVRARNCHTERKTGDPDGPIGLRPGQRRSGRPSRARKELGHSFAGGSIRKRVPCKCRTSPMQGVAASVRASKHACRFGVPRHRTMPTNQSVVRCPCGRQAGGRFCCGIPLGITRPRRPCRDTHARPAATHDTAAATLAREGGEVAANGKVRGTVRRPPNAPGVRLGRLRSGARLCCGYRRTAQSSRMWRIRVQRRKSP